MNKIKSMNNLNVIGITGSYGKTSSKNILNDILNSKYNSIYGVGVSEMPSFLKELTSLIMLLL